MKSKIVPIMVTAGICFFLHIPFQVSAQAYDALQVIKQNQEQELGKDKQRKLDYASTVYLIEHRQFVFKAEFGQGSEEVFIVVDTSSATVQAGNRNSLTGRITDYRVTKNDKKGTISVTIKIHSTVATADVFLFLEATKKGRATIRSDAWSAAGSNASFNEDFPGNYTFDGLLQTINQATFYRGGSHLVH